MDKLKVYIGWDPRDDKAFKACVASLLDHSSIPVNIIPLLDHELRRAGVYWRSYAVERNGQKIDDKDGRPFSTDFSFTRFAIPLFDKSDEKVLFIDADMLFMDDIANLLKHAKSSKAVQCVQHNYEPEETTKFDGFKQERYFRKNWSSVMLINPSKCTITAYEVNNQTGSFLHGLLWQDDDTIGSLPEEWNWLEGWSNPDIKPSLIHYTRGTPDMIGNDIPHAKLWWSYVNKWHPTMNESGINYENDK